MKAFLFLPLLFFLSLFSQNPLYAMQTRTVTPVEGCENSLPAGFTVVQGIIAPRPVRNMHIPFLEGNVYGGESWREWAAANAVLADQTNLLMSTGKKLPAYDETLEVRRKALKQEAEDLGLLWQEAVTLHWNDAAQADMLFKKLLLRFNKAAAQIIDMQLRAHAQFKLAEMYYHGFGCDVDFGQSLRLHYAVAIQNDDLFVAACAGYRLGEYYAYGLGMEPDNKKAMKVFLAVASQQASPWARVKARLQVAAQWYDQGSFENARIFSEELIDQDICPVARAEAQYLLASMCLFGQGGPKNSARAQELVTRILNEKVAHQFVFGAMYLQGCLHIESNNSKEGETLLMCVSVQNINETAQALALKKLQALNISLA